MLNWRCSAVSKVAEGREMTGDECREARERELGAAYVAEMARREDNRRVSNGERSNTRSNDNGMDIGRGAQFSAMGYQFFAKPVASASCDDYRPVYAQGLLEAIDMDEPLFQLPLERRLLSPSTDGLNMPHGFRRSSWPQSQ
jgi:hypothetical protein